MKNIFNFKIFLIAIVFLVFGFFIFKEDDSKNEIVVSDSKTEQKTKIAVCPSCQKISEKIDNEKYEIIKTNSTAKSLSLLKAGKVDIIMSGRTLKPNEPELDYLKIKEEGYSFLAKRSAYLKVDDLKNYTIYTDQEVETLLNIFPIEKIEKVEDVYQYLNKGIVITSWENTNYDQAEIVHLFQENQERVELSRRPTIYCLNACDEKIKELALTLKQ